MLLRISYTGASQTGGPADHGPAHSIWKHGLAAAQVQQSLAGAEASSELQTQARDLHRDAVRQLHAALRTERSALHWFLDVIQMQVLTPLQEAWLDAVCPLQPWCPDWWAMSNALAAQHADPQVCLPAASQALAQ